MQLGMMNVGIELIIRGDDVKMFYNIGTEKRWILSAMEDLDKIADTRENMSPKANILSQNFPFWQMLAIVFMF